MSFYPDLDPTTSLEGASNDRLESVRKGAALRPDVDAAAFFLDALFPTEHWPGHVLIWTLNRETQKKLSHWCLSLEKAKEVITEHSSAWSRHDVYVGMGVSSPHASIGRGEGDLSPYRRLLAQPDVDIDTGDVRPTPFVHFIPGLWADVYVGEEGHHGSTGKRYAPDLETVLERLPELPIQPTIVVNSGHGTQLFWVFDELLDISPDRLAAALRQSDWIDLLRGVFHPYTLDSVSDLSRLMRLAGFINNKLPSRRVLTEVISSNGPTTTPDAVDTLLSSRRKTGGDRSSGHANKMGGPNGSPSFDPNAEVDEAKFQAAYHHNQRFAGAWDGQRLDLKDKSDSGYDMALAHEAVKLGWTPQEIIDLLIARRRMAKAKAKSKGHYELTVRKALNAQQTRLHHEGQEHSKAQRGRGPTATKEGDIAAAEEYITEVATSEDVVYWLDEFHQNQMGVWREQSKRFFENKLRGRIGRARGSGDHVVISRETVASCMGSLTSAITPPCIDTSMLRANDRLKNFDLDSGELLQGSAFANGILHVGADGGMNLVERKSRHFYQTARPYNFPTEKPSRPEKFDSWLQDCVPDEGTRTAFWELLGATVAQELHGRQQLVALIGPGRSGKGTALKIVTMLLGQEFTVIFTGGPGRIAKSQFTLAGLEKAALALLPDMPPPPFQPGIRMDQYNEGLSYIRSIVGGDAVTIEKEHRDPADTDDRWYPRAHLHPPQASQ